VYKVLSWFTATFYELMDNFNGIRYTVFRANLSTQFVCALPHAGIRNSFGNGFGFQPKSKMLGCEDLIL